jgi:hypothetical protein
MNDDSPRWLTTEQIRKQQRCGRQTVLKAMDSGELPFEQRGRVRYARVVDVIRWEEKRLRKPEMVERKILPELAHLA